MNLSRSFVAAIAGIAVAAFSAGVVSATAATTVTPGVSSNWAGYVASGTDAQTLAATTFSDVSGSWVEPKADCSAVALDGATSSAFWVGLGGNATTSRALEQTGTEADCSAAGTPNYFAWYELVPAGSVQLRLAIKPGDHISASVAVHGNNVSIVMHDLTRGTGFSKTLRMSAPDTTSAEWIAEAPSICSTAVNCNQQALTDFGTVKFTGSNAISSAGSGSITSQAWNTSEISLESSASGGFYGGGYGHHFGGEIGASEAVPTGTSDGGAAFSITWKNVSVQQPGGGGYGGGGYGYGGGGYGY